MVFLSSNFSLAIESFEHWGLGLAPIFSFPTSSQLKQESDAGLGGRIYYRKNMREYGVEIGADHVEYATTRFQTTSLYSLGLYRFYYLDTLDFAVGAGGGKKWSDLKGRDDSELFLKFRGMIEMDLAAQHTLTFAVEYDWQIEKGVLDENLQDLKVIAGYTYYFGFYNLGE